MDKMVYVAMNAAQQSMVSQTVLANNLANVNTVGFKEDLACAVERHVQGTGFEGRVFSQTQSAGFNAHAGGMIATGEDLDVAIQGEGWIAIRDSQGQEAYTRVGALRITADRVLETADRVPVVGQGGPIRIPAADKIDIAPDGTVGIIPQGGGPQSIVPLDRIKLVNPPAADLEKGADGLFRLRTGGTAPADPRVQLASGFLESSNVNAVSALVDMISVARAFEINLNLMKTARENDAHAAQLMQIRA